MEEYTTDMKAREDRHVHGHDSFIKALVPSYISMDTEGRVIRLDSLSKTLAQGLRFGWIVAQANLLERFVRLHEMSINSPSGLTISNIWLVEQMGPQRLFGLANRLKI